MVKQHHIRIAALISLVLAALGAAAQSVKLQVRQQVAEGTKFQVVIQIVDMDAQPPQTIAIPNCTLLYGPAISTGSSFTSINGQSSSSTFINAAYTFRADKASTVTIPEFTVVDASGRKHTTKPATLTILPAGQRPAATQQPGMGFGQPDRPVVDPKDYFSANDMFVRISVDKRSVYEQEPVVATIRLYTLHDIASFQMLTQPTFEGFLSEELDVREPYTTETVDGKEYTTAVLKRCVLYPQRSGHLKLSSGTYEVVLRARVRVNTGSFIPDFRIVEKQLRTPESVASIDVRALPQPAPASFDGAVGDFTARAELSPGPLRTDEPATYTLVVSGTGNIKYLKTPDLQMPPGIDLYTPKTDIDATYSRGDITGTYTVTYTLVPQEVGSFHIPPLDFTYFNPRSAEYRTVTLPGYDVKVAKGAGTSVAEQRSIAKGMTDILHIHGGSHALTPQVHFLYHRAWYWGAYAALALAFATVLIVYRRQLRLNADVRGRQLARALRKAMKRFKSARAAMAAHDPERFYADINQALWGYLGDKLGIPASQLVRDNIAQQLADYGVDAAGIDDIITVLDDCEMARFTPMGGEAGMAQVYDRVVSAVKSIEKTKTR